MSYNINITGHKETTEGAAFEEEIANKAKEFVASLEGVSGASLSGAHIGTVSLLPAPEPPGDEETMQEGEE